MRAGCKVAMTPDASGCDHHRHWVRVFGVDLDYIGAKGEEIRSGVVTYYHNCKNNLLSALRNRVLADVPKASKGGIKSLQEQARKMVRRLRSVAPWDRDDVLNHFKGAKRRRYEDAANRYDEEGATYRDATVDLFVKSEATPITSTFKAPRAIQPRSYVYGYALARYIKPVEEVIYLLSGFCQRGVEKSRVIAKGLSQCQRAKLLHVKSGHFSDPVWLTLDASRFDLHVCKGQLRVEHSVYLSMLNDPEFQRLLSWQLVNHGRVRSIGLKYTSDGGRMSGDMNTAVGNCLLMLLMVAETMDRIGCPKFDVLDDGDDIVVIVEKGWEKVLQEKAFDIFLDFGHEVKIENIAYSFEDLEWCQCHPVEVETGRWKLVRNPVKILTKGVSGTKYFTNPDEGTRRKLINSVGHCERVLNLGVPVLQSYAEMLIRLSGTRELLNFDSVDEYFHRVGKELKGMNCSITEVKSRVITFDARMSFERAFGIRVEDQCELEEWFENVTVPILGSVDVAEEVDMAMRNRFFGSPTSLYSPGE
jgi:hypothetical protein